MEQVKGMTDISIGIDICLWIEWTSYVSPLGCPVSECYITDNINHFGKDQHDKFDAVVIDAVQLRKEQVPFVTNIDWSFKTKWFLDRMQ